MKWNSVGLRAFALTASLGLGACATLPRPPTPQKVVSLPQNWTPAQAEWFHHVSQGTATLPVPFEWFMALEEPSISLFGGPKLFSDTAYLRRWVFIEDAPSSDNPAGLPIGFAPK